MRLLLFDIDGTLVHTRGAGREATRLAMLEVFGIEGDIARHRFGGKTDWQTLLELLEPHGYSDADIGRIMPTYNAAVGRHIAAIIHHFAVEPCPGALDLLAELRRRDDLLLGLVTGNVEAGAGIKLRAAGIDPEWFPVGAYGSEARSRDDLPPLALRRAIQHAHHDIPPSDVIVIGDTVADVNCARALGAVAVAVGTGFEARGDLLASQPDHFLDDLTTFLPLLN